MSKLILVAGVLAFAACKGNVETKRVEKLDLKDFTIAVPADWNEVTDARLTGKMAPGSHTLMMSKPPSGFVPSIYVQELEMSPTDHQQLVAASDASCKDVLLPAMASATNTNPVSSKAVDYHGLKGCELSLTSKDSAQGARQITLSNGKVGISVTCNHDKAGNQPEADAGCKNILDAIAAK